MLMINNLLITSSTSVDIYLNPKEKFSKQQQHSDALKAQYSTFVLRSCV